MENFITFNELAILLRGDVTQNIPVALFSRPGTGKSSFLKDLSATRNTEVFTIAINQIADRSDLTGIRLVDKLDANGEKYYQQEVFPHATLMQAIRFAEANPDKTGIIFLDEFNRAAPDVTTATLSFTTERKIGTVEFPPNIRFVLAGNKEGNVVPFDDATSTRFSIYDVVPDHLTFLNVNKELNPFIRDLIVDDAGYLLGEPLNNKSSKNTTANPYVATPTPEKDDDTFEAFTDDDGITQDRTVPRTLTMLSGWLNGEGFDKSGSAEELKALAEFLQETQYGQGAGHHPTLLQVSIEAKIGKTGTAIALVDSIINHSKELNKKANATVKAGGQTMTNAFDDILKSIRPLDDRLVQLKAAESRTDIMECVEEMDSEELANMMLWLLTNESYHTLDTVATPLLVMEEVAQKIGEVNVRAVRIFNQVIAQPDYIARRSLDQLKKYTPEENTKLLSLVSFAEQMLG